MSSTVRRSAVLALAALFVAAAALWFAGDDVAPSPSGDPAGGVATAPIGDGPDGSRDPGRDPGRRITDTEPRRGDAEPNTAAAARGPRSFRVVAAGTREPIATAVIASLRSGAEVGRTDAEGRVTVTAGTPLTQLVFSADGYLATVFLFASARQAAVVESLRAGDVATVQLEPDVYTIPVPLRFVDASARDVADVRFRLEALDEPRPSAVAVPWRRPGRAPVELEQTWRAHTIVARIAEHRRRLRLHLGDESRRVVFAAPPGDTVAVRVVAPGRYRCLARAADGRTATRDVTIEAGAIAGVERASIDVVLRPATWLRGDVRSAASSNAPLADAEVSVVGAALDQLVEDVVVTTGADGTFALGPLPSEPGVVRVRVRHGRHEVFETDVPPAAREQRLAVVLQPLATWALEVGIVAAGSERVPIGGARVVVHRDGQLVLERVSDAEGRCELSLPAEPVVVTVAADGYLDWTERLEGATQLEFVLVPEDVERRVAAGVSAVVAGRVFDANGATRAGARVQIRFDEPSDLSIPNRGVLGARRVLGGARPPQPAFVTADENGRYRLECIRRGPARVYVLEGVVDPARGAAVQVELGRRIDGVDLYRSR